MHTYMSVCIYVCIHICVYIYIYIYTHTHMCNTMSCNTRRRHTIQHIPSVHLHDLTSPHLAIVHASDGPLATTTNNNHNN